MKPGYYWVRHREGVIIEPVQVVLHDAGLRILRIGNGIHYRIDGFWDFLGTCKPPGIRVARVKAPGRTPVDHSRRMTWRVNVPAAKSRHHFSIDTEGQAVEWIVHASTYDDARVVFRREFGLTRIPIGTTFTRIEA